jgi:hypothetical protein
MCKVSCWAPKHFAGLLKLLCQGDPLATAVKMLGVIPGKLMGSEHSTLDGPRTAIPNKFYQLWSASWCTLRAKRMPFLIHDASISIQLADVFFRRDYTPQLRNYVYSLPRGSLWKMTDFLASGNFTESVRIRNFCIGKFIKYTEPNNPVIIFCLPPSDTFPLLRGHWPINEFEIKIN